ncbi:MAG TPA: DUF5658 family protein [Isosphaeraceae bacterium]|jgi:hypothetical protein|nr:DUF5658 family protein [Isosphaeraceae bacterium]
MTILLRCAGCRKLYSIDAEHAGRRSRCRACGHVQRIEAPAGPEPALGGSALADVPEPPIEHAAAPVPTPPRPTKRGGLLGGVWEPSRIQREGALLVLVSVIDLFVTYALLRRSPRFYESNPVAQWFFARWNIAGMALFKFGVIGAVIAIGEVIERRRPRWGRAVLWIGCLAAAYAIYCGLRLLLGPAGVDAPAADSIGRRS